ncbi:MAG: transglycosylase domain-containing protein [Acidimicrobiales bacterium]
MLLYEMNYPLRILKYLFSSVWLALVTVIGVPIVAGVTFLTCLVLLPLPASIPVAKAAVPTGLPTTVYDRNGSPIATLQQYDQNIPVAQSQVPTVLKEAVVSDEDRNFYKEGGVDPRGIVRAALADIQSNAPVQGASTITEQYVKLAYGDVHRTVYNKVREAILASQLDRQASKDDILYHYLTIIYFGDGSYGIGAAAEDYFRVPVQDLNLSQAATLAGLIPAPSSRAPREHLAAAESSRELVLNEMLQQGYITQAQFSQATESTLALATTGPPAPGTTLVYGPSSTPTKYPSFVSYVTQWLLEHYPPSVVYGGGLRVQTTLDPAIQADADAAVGATLAGTTDPLEMALVAVQPQTGFVEAMVGGRARGGNGLYGEVNLALGGCDYGGTTALDKTLQDTAQTKSSCWSQAVPTGGGSGRQPGSAWKPFVLATALEQGISPETVFPAPGVLPIPGCKPGSKQDCLIHNDEGQGGYPISLRTATVASVNTVFAQLAEKVGCPGVAATARAMGITSAFYDPRVQPFCAPYALGEVDVSPLDMASAYGVFADHGRRAPATPILEIVNPNDKILVDNLRTPPRTTTVLPANVADNVTNVLQGVLGPGGTAGGLGLDRPAAGKTGTASNYTNAWFVGYTPTLSTAVWMGNAASQAATINYKGDTKVFGASYSAPTWRNFMNQALAGVPATQFNQPAPIMPAAPLSDTTTTVPHIEAGAAQPPQTVPPGGPYTVPPPPAYIPFPPSSATTTTTTALPGLGFPPGVGPQPPGGTTTTTTLGLFGP